MATTRRTDKGASTRPIKRVAPDDDAAGESERKPTAKRRKRGDARGLLLGAARELFTSQGFSGTTTREIAERAGVSEVMLFRYFGSKVGIFREALVVPFIEFVEDFNAKWHAGGTHDLDAETMSRRFIQDLYDLFRRNRGIVVMLWAADAQGGSDLAEAGVFDEVNDELRVLVEIGTAEAQRRHGRTRKRQDLVTRCTLAMVAGMAVFGKSFYGKEVPSRKEIVDELNQAVMYGHNHRSS